MPSVNYVDRTLQVVTCLIYANTSNMREDIETSSSSLIEVDPYRRSSRSASRNCNVSSIDLKTGRVHSGVDR